MKLSLVYVPKFYCIEMVLTFEDYQKLSGPQRRQLKKSDLQALIDDAIADTNDVTTLRSIIRDELTNKFNEHEKTINATIKAKLTAITNENERLTQENKVIKKVLNEQQKFLERTRKEDTKNNIFISGIPNELSLDLSTIPTENTNEKTNNHAEIIHHILNFVEPGIKKKDYKILMNFDCKEGYSRHSAKIRINNLNLKSRIFKGCKSFKELHTGNYLKKIFIKNDDPPMTRKENDRLFQKMKCLRNSEDQANPVNKYHIKSGKLYKNNDEIIDEFNLAHQLFL